MSRTRATGVFAIALALVSTSCGGGSSPPTSPSATSTPTVAAQPLVNGDLEPGTYSFDGLGEPFQITLGEGWQGLVFEQRDKGDVQLAQFFALFNKAHPAANIAFLQPTRVVDPTKDWDDEGNIVPVPSDLISWFADLPMLDASDPSGTEIAGREASAVDITVVDVPKNGWPGCGGTCMLWIPVSVDHENGPVKDDDLIFAGGLHERDREIVVDVNGQQVLIDIGATDAKSWKVFLPLAEQVLGTIRIG